MGYWYLSRLQIEIRKIYNQSYSAMNRNTKLKLNPPLDDEFMEPKFLLDETPSSYRNVRCLSMNSFESPRYSITTRFNPTKATQQTTSLQHLQQADTLQESQSISPAYPTLAKRKTFKSPLKTTSPAKSKPTLIANKTRKKKKQQQLKDMITKQKIENLRNIFMKKIKRNNIYATPIQFQIYKQGNQQSILQKNGFELNYIIDNTIAFLSVLQIISLCILYTLSLVFVEIQESPWVTTMQTFSLFFYLVEIVINFLTVKSANGRRLTTLRQIWMYYIHKTFMVDAVSVLILIIDISTNLPPVKIIRLFIVCKLGQCLQKMQKLEVFFIRNYHNEQYWSLIKVFLFNFCFAHILAIALTAMANINPAENWLITHKLDDAVWYQRYVWAYYWGTNVMLTVGFGDFVATTYQQAICLIFIEMVSCICLAYNINCVGTLISNIRQQDLEKSKNFKMFKQLADKNNLPEELSWKINNYIEESVNIKKKFNIEEESIFVEKLPAGFKREFLKESNKVIFQNLVFFKSLVEKTLYNFAEKIQMHICHPEQIIRPVDDGFNLIILKTGDIGYCGKKPHSIFNEIVIDKMRIEEDAQPYLIGLEFITKKRPYYQVKSLEYSIIYYLDYQKLIATLKETNLDFQLYCLLRDKNKNVVDEFEVMPCAFCNEKHTKIDCPKLHYIPFHQQVINKYIKTQHVCRNDRNELGQRIIACKQSTLKRFTKIQMITDQIEASNNRNYKSKKTKQNGMMFLDRLRVVEIETSAPSGKAEEADFFFKNATEMIKLELNRALRTENGEDEVWTVNTDRMKNYKGYFASDNSCYIEDKTNVEARIENMRKQGLLIMTGTAADENIQQKAAKYFSSKGLESPFAASVILASKRSVPSSNSQSDDEYADQQRPNDFIVEYD